MLVEDLCITLMVPTKVEEDEVATLSEEGDADAASALKLAVWNLVVGQNPTRNTRVCNSLSTRHSAMLKLNVGTETKKTML